MQAYRKRGRAVFGRMLTLSQPGGQIITTTILHAPPRIFRTCDGPAIYYQQNIVQLSTHVMCRKNKLNSRWHSRFDSQVAHPNQSTIWLLIQKWNLNCSKKSKKNCWISLEYIFTILFKKNKVLKNWSNQNNNKR